jgi:hypothetical protein
MPRLKGKKKGDREKKTTDRSRKKSGGHVSIVSVIFLLDPKGTSL